MASYFTGLVIAVVMVFGLYATVEISAGKTLFSQDRLGRHSVEDLIKISHSPISPDRVNAILQLGKRKKQIETVFPVLANLTLSGESLIKNAAESSIQNLGPDATPLVRQFFEMKTLNGSKMACSTIRAIGPSCKIYMPEIKTLLESDKSIERRCGLYALQGMGDEALVAIDGIVNCVLDEDFNNQCSACRILETFGANASAAEPELLELLKNGNPSTRGWAAICLGKIGPTSTNPDVAQLLASRLDAVNPIELQRVLAGLANLGPSAKNVLADVEEKMNTSEKFIQAQASFAVWRITGNPDRTLKILGDQMNDAFHSAEASDLIGKMGSAGLPLLDTLLNNLNSTDVAIREISVVAIGNIGPAAKSAIPKLTPLLDDPDGLVRTSTRHALEALKESKQPK